MSTGENKAKTMDLSDPYLYSVWSHAQFSDATVVPPKGNLILYLSRIHVPVDLIGLRVKSQRMQECTNNMSTLG